MVDIKDLFKEKTCVICGLLTSRYLCRAHRKGFHYITDYGFFASKGRFQASVPQTEVFRALRAHFKKRTFQEVSFNWYSYARYDIVIPDIKLIVEYMGEQHDHFVKFFHKTEEGFKHYIEKDKNKKLVAEQNGYRLIEISHVEPISEKGYIIKKLKLKGIT